ncbi:MAG: thiamine-monophosphate kinase [Miltoncostaeaceae bacterium]|jgi:thiamine-monophosphate kinase|nr:thiamine-monophosphate kinase [Miltoncostaeaceae bacterium]
MPAKGGAAAVPEIALIERIAARARRRPGLAVGIGDDAAVLEGDPAVVATQDLLVEDVHFRRATTGLADLGHKALAVNLSDLAAMGADAVAALVGLGLPQQDGPGAEEIDELYAGMEALAERCGVSVAGGDVTAAPVMVLSVCALGRMPAGVPPLLRSGAREGDLLCVTGALGAAAAGLILLERPGLTVPPEDAARLVAAHRRPEPRLAAGRALAEGGAHAMLDCSDGLALDALRMARASGLALTIELERLPLAAGVAAVAAATGRDPELLAATGGEDYELIAAVPPAELERLRASLDLPLTVVGRFRPGPAALRLERAGEEVAAPRLGWEHGA